MKVLDLYSCQGGASAGYGAAGFEPTGVDKDYQPRYPYAFHAADAIAFVQAHGREYDFIHASPPCQFDSDCQRIQGREHPDLIGPTREALEAVGVPWVIENVGGAVPKLRNPVELCGTMFGLRTYRHRYFETGGWEFTAPEHPGHVAQQVKMGRPLKPGDFYHAVGNFSNVPYVRADMGVHWMSRDGIRECIPPAYTRYIGEQFLKWRAREPRRNPADHHIGIGRPSRGRPSC